MGISFIYNLLLLIKCYNQCWCECRGYFSDHVDTSRSPFLIEIRVTQQFFFRYTKHLVSLSLEVTCSKRSSSESSYVNDRHFQDDDRQLNVFFLAAFDIVHMVSRFILQSVTQFNEIHHFQDLHLLCLSFS